MTDAGLVPAEPEVARRELRRSILRSARPMAPVGVVIVVNQQWGAGRHLETAAMMRVGLRVAAASYAVLAVASRLGRGLIGLRMADDCRTADEPVRCPAVEQVGGGPLLNNVAGVVGTAAAVRFVGRVGRAAPT